MVALWLLNGSLLLFEPLDILVEGMQKAFRVMRSQKNSTAHLGLFHAGHHLSKVHHEFNRAVGDYR